MSETHQHTLNPNRTYSQHHPPPGPETDQAGLLFHHLGKEREIQRENYCWSILSAFINQYISPKMLIPVRQSSVNQFV